MLLDEAKNKHNDSIDSDSSVELIETKDNTTKTLTVTGTKVTSTEEDSSISSNSISKPEDNPDNFNLRKASEIFIKQVQEKVDMIDKAIPFKEKNIHHEELFQSTEEFLRVLLRDKRMREKEERYDEENNEVNSNCDINCTENINDTNDIDVIITDHIITPENNQEINEDPSDSSSIASSTKKKYNLKNIHFYKDASSTRVHFTYDKQRCLGSFSDDDQANFALDILRSKLDEECVESTESMDEIVPQIRHQVKNKLYESEKITLQKASSKSIVPETSKQCENGRRGLRRAAHENPFECFAYTPEISQHKSKKNKLTKVTPTLQWTIDCFCGEDRK